MTRRSSTTRQLPSTATGPLPSPVSLRPPLSLWCLTTVGPLRPLPDCYLRQHPTGAAPLFGPANNPFDHWRELTPLVPHRPDRAIVGKTRVGNGNKGWRRCSWHFYRPGRRGGGLFGDQWVEHLPDICCAKVKVGKGRRVGIELVGKGKAAGSAWIWLLTREGSMVHASARHGGRSNRWLWPGVWRKDMIEVGRSWAEGPKWLGRRGNFKGKMKRASNGIWAKLVIWVAKLISNLNQRVLNIFKPNFELDSKWRNLNKLFGNFSNLEF
jgi:hypothetical protein